MLNVSVRRLFKGLYRLCQCGCGYLILVINKQKKFARYKSGHNPIDYSKRIMPTRENNHNWKGGIKELGKGYLGILRPHHKHAHPNGYVLLHRYRMELMLGRYLTKKEVVHHRDGNPKNNDESNLMLFGSNGEHVTFEHTKDMSGRVCKFCKSKKTRIKIKNSKKYYEWYGNEIDGFYCYICYKKERIRKRSLLRLEIRFLKLLFSHLLTKKLTQF